MSTSLSEPLQPRKRRVTSRCVAVLVLALLLCYLLWSPASGGDIDGAPFHGRSGQTELHLPERARGAKGGRLAETMDEAGACSSTKRLQGDKGTWGAEADAILRREATMLALPDTTDVVSKLRRVLSTLAVQALLSSHSDSDPGHQTQARDSSNRKGTVEDSVEVQTGVDSVAKVERPAIPSDAPASFDVLRAQDNIVADLRAVRRRAAARRLEAHVVAHYRALVSPSVLKHLPTENDLKMGFGVRSSRPRGAVSSLDVRDAFEHYGVVVELQQYGAEECAAAAASANVSIWSARIAWSAEVTTYTPEQRRAMLLFAELLIGPGSTAAANAEKTPLSLESLMHRAEGEKNGGPGSASDGQLSREGRASRFQRLTRWLLPAHAPLDLGECTAVGHKNDRPARHNGDRGHRAAADRQSALSNTDTIDADTGDAVQRLEARIESVSFTGASTLGAKGKTTAAAHADVNERDKAGVFRVVSQGVNRAVLRNVCVSPHGGGLSSYAVPLTSQRTGASIDRVRLFKHPGAFRDHTLRGRGEGRLSMVQNFTADVQDLFSIGEDLDTGESKAARKARRRRSLFFAHQDKVAEAKAKAGHGPSTHRTVQSAVATSPQRHSDDTDVGSEKARIRSLPAVLWSTTHVDERGNVVKGVFVSRRRRPPPPRCIVKRTVPFVFPAMYQSNNIGHALFREMSVRRAVQAFESEEQQRQPPNGHRGNSPHHARRAREPVLLYYVTPDARSTFDSTTAHRLFHSLWRRDAGTQRPQHSNATPAPPYKWFSVLGAGHESGRIRRQAAASILGPHTLRSSALWQTHADGRGDGDEVCFAELHVSWDVLPMYAKGTGPAVVKDRDSVRRAFVDLRARVSHHLLGLPPLTTHSTAGTATPPGHVRVLLVDRSYRRMGNLYTEILPSLVRTNTTRLTFVGRRVRALARAAGLVSRGTSTSVSEQRDHEKANGTASGVVGMDITVVDFAAVEVEHQAALVAQHDILVSTHGTALQWAFMLRAGREAVGPQSPLSPPQSGTDVSRPIPVLVEVQYKHYGCALPGVGPPNAAECEFGQSAAAAGAEYIVWRAPPGDASACAAVPRGCDVAPRPAAFAELLRVAVCVHRRGSGGDCGPRHTDFFS